MKPWLVALACGITVAAMLAYGQSPDGEGYQMARVVAFERIAANAQHMEGGDGYKISMRMGSIIYNCRASGAAATFIDWTTGKEFPAKINAPNGKTLLVKNPDGQIVEMTIVGKKTPK